MSTEPPTLRPKEQNQGPVEQTPRKGPIESESADTVPKKLIKVDERFGLANLDKTNSWSIKDELAELLLSK